MKPLTLTLPAELARAAELAAWVEGAVTAWNLPPARAHALHLCAEEIFANVAMHAAPAEVTVTLEGDATRQVMVFTDTGPPFDPTSAPPPPPPTDFDSIGIGGRGLLLVRRFAGRMEYAREDGRNRLELTFG
ncbi:ATP-binding protein [Roseococcus microcysteis]|uniref:ATP-binding protein n=1 Tax=Roseococcus microcysteis TaxID=2771361 RepID=UPI00168A995A|nr:ATP-binding protein [Roseococcus microcysteis]